MKIILLAAISFLMLMSCKKAMVGSTDNSAGPIPWTDSSSKHPKNAAYKALIEKYVKKGLPGISLLVNDEKGTWIGSSGKADLQNNISFMPAQVAKVASITKLFIGVLAFKMMEDSVKTGIGYSALNKPIATWLPERITGKLTNGSRITLGQCMKHETGLADVIEENKFYLEVLNDPNRSWNAEDLLKIVYQKPEVFAPGDTAIYSNTNTILVSMVLESTSGKKHGDLLKTYILNPLSLTNTFYQPYDALPASTAQGYFDLYNNNTIVNVSNWITGSGNGYGGIYSNIFDLYNLINSLLIKKTLLKPASLAIMQSFGKTDDINQYGYGIMKKFINRGINYGLGHSGRDLGYTANLFYFPEKKVTHAFIINYGTDANSGLKAAFTAFQDELIDLSLQ